MDGSLLRFSGLNSNQPQAAKSKLQHASVPYQPQPPSNQSPSYNPNQIYSQSLALSKQNHSNQKNSGQSQASNHRPVYQLSSGQKGRQPRNTENAENIPPNSIKQRLALEVKQTLRFNEGGWGKGMFDKNEKILNHNKSSVLFMHIYKISTLIKHFRQ